MPHDQGDHIGAQVLAEAKGEGVSTQMHNVDGDPADVLTTVAETAKADLVVVGNPRYERDQALCARERCQQGVPPLPARAPC